MRGKFTLAYLGLWETMNNVDFKPLEFERFKNEAGYNYFVLSPQQWIEKTNAKGIIPKSGRYGGTFAHIDPFDVLIILQRMLTVVIAPALIITKLLVSPSNNLLTTGQTFRNN